MTGCPTLSDSLSHLRAISAAQSGWTSQRTVGYAIVGSPGSRPILQVKKEEDIAESRMLLDSVSGYLTARIAEISFLLSSMLMVFASDLIMGRMLLRRLRKLDFVTRTLAFVLYALLALPAMTTLGAYLLRVLILEPFKEQILAALAIFFLIVGVLLSRRYNMKFRVKPG